jgi:exodeoxyribonuclease VII small subunit
MAAQEKKFEDELKELEDTVARIDSGELSLEESIKAFEQGVALVRSLNQKLDQVEKKIEVLVRDSQGELRTTPYRVEIKSGDEDDELPS